MLRYPPMTEGYIFFSVIGGYLSIYTSKEVVFPHITYSYVFIGLATYILENVDPSLLTIDWSYQLYKNALLFYCNHFQIWRDTFIPCFVFTDISIS